ncbi:MAG: sigma 54-interacting transcriptional regulator [Deltaproteobacteria bacterium]|nr:sigma 54-interacting transcriptional regulator [Deltaproteobacteria bacterium]
MPLNNQKALSRHLTAQAALFEGAFSVDILQEITGLKASQILKVMEDAIDSGLLVKQGPGQYRFKKTQDRIRLQSSLDKSEIESLHKTIANCLLNTEQDAEAVLLAAEHLLQITNDLDGCRRLLNASKWCRWENQYPKALACSSKAVQDLLKLKGVAADSLLADVAIEYSKASEAATDVRPVTEALKKALRRAKGGKDRAKRAHLQVHLAKNEFYLANTEQAFEIFDKGWGIARDTTDPGLKRSATTLYIFFLHMQGHHGEVRRYYEGTMPDVERYPKNWFPFMTSCIIGQCYALTGQVTQGMGMLDAIYGHSRKQGNFFISSLAASEMGKIMLNIGRIDDALRYFEDANEKGTRAPNNLSVPPSLAGSAAACLKMRDVDGAVKFLEKYISINGPMKVHFDSAFPQILDISWAMETGELPRVTELPLENLIDQYLKGRNLSLKGSAYRYRAFLAKRNGASHEKIIRSLMRSASWLEKSENQLELVHTRIEMAKEYLDYGNENKAREMMKGIAQSPEAALADMVPEPLKFLLADFRTEPNLVREMMRLGQELVTLRDNREVVRQILRTANQITGAERAAIFFMEADTPSGRLSLRASRNLAEEDIAEPAFSAAMNIIRESATTGKGRVLVKNPAEAQSPFSDTGIRGCICVPMKLRGEVLGVLYLDNRLFSSSFKESDRDILDYFAAQAAIAMDNAAAYEKIHILNRKLREEKRYYEEEHSKILHFDEFVGKSPAIMKVLSLVEQVAGLDTSVLVLGETGVGKELVARAIHRHSTRKHRPFVSTNCAALPENLIANELFGHERGAFTGADSQRIGRFELADGGTLFLDEIAEISLEVQVRLLRVLQTKEFERLGGQKTHRSDFRLVAATNRELHRAVNAGTFREDLYYRLNVFPIHVPPLRDRIEDIPLLAAHFLHIHALKCGKPIQKITESDMQRLVTYDWPGNVRELENIIERGTILSTGPRFRLPELKRHLQGRDRGDRAVTYEENIRRHILWAIEKTRGKIRGDGGAAQLLDMSPSTLYYKIKAMGIRRSTGN